MFFLPFGNGIYSIRKEFAPRERKFFHCRVDPFSEGDWCAVFKSKQEVTKSVSLVKMVAKSLRVSIHLVGLRGSPSKIVLV